MPGGFLKKLGTASCAITGTSVAVARLCAESGSSANGTEAIDRAASSHSRRRVIRGSPRPILQLPVYTLAMPFQIARRTLAVAAAAGAAFLIAAVVHARPQQTP